MCSVTGMLAHASQAKQPASPGILGRDLCVIISGCANIATSPDRSSMRQLSTSFLKSFLLIATCFGLLLAGSTLRAVAQDDPFGDSAADPIKLFERGQSAHSRGQLEKAIDFYEQALKVKPDFPEAEFQRGNALASLGRLKEGEAALRIAISQKKNWSLPHSALGALLLRTQRDAEAEQSFRAALKIDANDGVALRMLSEIRLRAGDKQEALDLAKRATAIPDAPASALVVLAVAERANGNTAAAKAALDRVIGDEPANVAALLERADLFTDEKNFAPALADIRAAAKVKPGEKSIMSRLAYVLQQAGRNEEAAEVAKSAGLEVQQSNDPKGGVAGTHEEIEAANSDDPAVARKALEKLLEKNPRNAMLLGRLGASYRTDDPARSLEYYRRASELQPDAAEYAIGYASALVQARRFADATRILQQVVRANPQNYAARA